MMRSLLLLALLAVTLLATTATSVSYNSNLRHTDVKRVVDIRTHVEETSTTVKVSNTGSEAATYYLVAIPAVKVSHLSYVEGVFKKQRVLGTRVTVSGTKAPTGTEFWKLELPAPIKAGDNIQFNVLVAYTRTLRYVNNA